MASKKKLRAILACAFTVGIAASPFLYFSYANAEGQSIQDIMNIQGMPVIGSASDKFTYSINTKRVADDTVVSNEKKDGQDKSQGENVKQQLEQSEADEFDLNDVTVLCIAKGFKTTTVNEIQSYTCLVASNRKNIKVNKPVAFIMNTPTQYGSSSMYASIPITKTVTEKVTDDNGNVTEKKKEIKAYVNISINSNAYKGNTGIGGGGSENGYTDSTNGTGINVTPPEISILGGKDNPTDETINIHSKDQCKDGTYNCNNDPMDINILPPNEGTNDGVFTYKYIDTDGDGVPDTRATIDADGNEIERVPMSSLSDEEIQKVLDTAKADGWNGGDITVAGDSSGNSSSGSKYADILNDLLGEDNDAYNNKDDGWYSSDLMDDSADDNLDNYFNGVPDNTEAKNYADGLTGDILGLDDMLGDDATKKDYAVTKDTKSSLLGDSAGTFDDIMSDEDSSLFGGDDGYEADEGFLGTLNDLVSDGLEQLDGSSKKEESLSDAEKSSLIKDFMKVFGNKDEIEAQTASEQELYNLADKMLRANGMTLDDIKRGKNYDKNSAYTAPSVAWDMNRITTLAHNGKIVFPKE